MGRMNGIYKTRVVTRDRNYQAPDWELHHWLLRYDRWWESASSTTFISAERGAKYLCQCKNKYAAQKSELQDVTRYYKEYVKFNFTKTAQAMKIYQERTCTKIQESKSKIPIPK